MRILVNNIIENNSSILMSNQDTNYPVENIYTNMLEEIAKSSSSSSTIVINFSEDQSIDSIFFGWHNANSVIFTFKNSSGSVLHTETFSTPKVYAKKYVAKMTDVRSIEVSITSSDGNIFIGNISLGLYTQIYNVKAPISVSHIDTSKFEQSNGGQALYREGITLESFNVNCFKLTDDQVADFKTAFSYVHKGKTFWMDRNEDLDTMTWGFFNKDFNTSRIDTLTSLSFSFMEAR